MSIEEISDELLAAFIDGRCRPEERQRVLNALGRDPGLLEAFGLAAAAAQLETAERPSPGECAGRPARLPGPGMRLCCTDEASGAGDRCVVLCEQMILERFGVAVDPEELTATAQVQGWYKPGVGTALKDVGALARHFGLEVMCCRGGTPGDLKRALLHGAQVVVCLDEGELTGDCRLEAYEDACIGQIADHALVVADFEADEQGLCRVVVRDPATPGLYDRYPLEQFLDAWADGGFYMVVIRKPDV